MELTPQQEKKVVEIIKKVKEYLDIRFAHAVRINPKISHVYEDISWQQLESLRFVLSAGKAFGPIKFIVAEVLTGDDDNKRKALYNPVDQNSIMNEIVNQKEQSDKTKKRAGILDIKDIRSLYSALEPSLEKIVEVIQTWIWWDLSDACDYYHYEIQVKTVISLRDKPLNDEIITYYAKLHKKSKDEISKEYVIALEMEKLKHLLDRFEQRRDEEEGHEIIIKREEVVDDSEEQNIINLSKRILTLNKLNEMPDLEPNFREYYARILNMPADEVSRDSAIEFEERNINEMKKNLKKYLTDNKVYGAPYNYKQAQLKKMREIYISLEKSMPFLQKELEHIHQEEKDQKAAEKSAGMF